MTISTLQPFASWELRERKIYLFCEEKGFSFSTDEINGERFTFPLKFYSMDKAKNLIQRFHQTIGNNLANADPHSSCFLPQLCLETRNEPGVEIALFRPTNADLEPMGTMRWGIRTSTNEYSLPTNDKVVEIFFRNEALTTPKYPRTACTKRFSGEIIKDGRGGILGVDFHPISSLDPKVKLDEEHWAVTLLSLKQSIGYGCRRETGHGMIACEGIDQGKVFLRYIHLTAVRLGALEAELKIEEVQIPYEGTVNFQTITRKREDVARLLDFASAKKNPRSPKVSFNLLAPLWNTLSSAVDNQIDRVKEESTENCISYCVFLLEKANIFLPYPKWPEPNHYIGFLRSNYFIDNQSTTLHALPNYQSDRICDEVNYRMRNMITTVWGAPSSPKGEFIPTKNIDAAHPESHPKNQLFQRGSDLLHTELFVDTENVINLFREAADGGHPVAQYYMGILSLENFKESINHFIFDGVIDSKDLIALQQESSDHPISNGPDSLEWFRLSADQGHIGAKFGLGFVLMQRQGLLDTKYSNKKYAHFETSGLEHPEVLLELANRCFSVIPLHMSVDEWWTWKEVSEGRRMLYIAASLGSVEAFKDLGLHYSSDETDNNKLNKAKEWFQLALDGGLTSVAPLLELTNEYIAKISSRP